MARKEMKYVQAALRAAQFCKIIHMSSPPRFLKLTIIVLVVLLPLSSAFSIGQEANTVKEKMHESSQKSIKGIEKLLKVLQEAQAKQPFPTKEDFKFSDFENFSRWRKFPLVSSSEGAEHNYFLRLKDSASAKNTAKEIILAVKKLASRCPNQKESRQIRFELCSLSLNLYSQLFSKSPPKEVKKQFRYIRYYFIQDLKYFSSKSQAIVALREIEKWQKANESSDGERLGHSHILADYLRRDLQFAEAIQVIYNSPKKLKIKNKSREADLHFTTQQVLSLIYYDMGIAQKALEHAENALSYKMTDGMLHHKSHCLLLLMRFKEANAIIEDLLKKEKANLKANQPGKKHEYLCTQAIAKERIHRQEHFKTPALANKPAEVIKLYQNILKSEIAKAIIRFRVALRLSHLAIMRKEFETAKQYLKDAYRIFPITKQDQRQRFNSMALENLIALGQNEDPSVLVGHLRSGQIFLEQWIQKMQSSESNSRGHGLLRGRRLRLFVSTLIQLAIAIDESNDNGQDAIESMLLSIVSIQGLGSLNRSLQQSSSNGLEEANVQKIRELLPTKGALLLYWTSSEESFLLMLDHKNLKATKLASYEQLLKVRLQWTSLLLSPPSQASPSPERSSELNRAGKLVRSHLLPLPDANRLKPTNTNNLSWESCDSLVIVGLDMLGYTPFEALPWSPGSIGLQLTSKKTKYEAFQHLGMHKAVSYLPSIPVGLRLIERAKQKPIRHDEHVENQQPSSYSSILIASPIHSEKALRDYPDTKPLPLRAQEISALLASYPDNQKREFTGKEAAESPDLQIALANSQLAQFLAHGIQDPSQDWRPFLLLSGSKQNPSGYVGSDQFSSWQLPPSLILSACGLGRGQQRWGDPGITSLNAAIVLGGAQRYAMSYGDLELYSTHLLTKEMQKHLSQGDPFAKALQKARLTVAKSFPDPYFSCLLHAHGLAQEAVFPQSIPSENLLQKYWPFCLGSIPLLAALIFLTRKKLKANSELLGSRR